METRSQADVDRLFLFVILVVGVLVVVPTVLGAAGVDVRDGAWLGNNSADEGERAQTGTLVVLSTFGTDIGDNRSSVGVVEIVVTANETVDLTELTVGWRSEERYELVAPSVDAGDGSFSIVNSNQTTLGGDRERAILRFDMGAEDLDSADQFGDQLEPGDRVELSFVTDDGEETLRTLVVPDSLPERGQAVSLSG